MSKGYLPGQVLYDKDIRSILLDRFGKRRVVEEIDVSRSRVDLLDISRCLVGYEIKSDNDSLSRLKTQSKSYDQCFSRTYVVCGKKFADKIHLHVPSYWGIILVYLSPTGEPVIEKVRVPGINPHLNKRTILQMLWKSELVQLLKKLGYRGVCAHMRKNRLITEVGKLVNEKELGSFVSAFMRERKNWRE
jgi:hypothetical protein